MNSLKRLKRRLEKPTPHGITPEGAEAVAVRIEALYRARRMDRGSVWGIEKDMIELGREMDETLKAILNDVVAYCISDVNHAFQRPLTPRE